MCKGKIDGYITGARVTAAIAQIGMQCTHDHSVIVCRFCMMCQIMCTHTTVSTSLNNLRQELDCHAECMRIVLHACTVNQSRLKLTPPPRLLKLKQKPFTDSTLSCPYESLYSIPYTSNTANKAALGVPTRVCTDASLVQFQHQPTAAKSRG